MATTPGLPGRDRLAAILVADPGLMIEMFSATQVVTRVGLFRIRIGLLTDHCPDGPGLIQGVKYEADGACLYANYETEASTIRTSGVP